jgi:hypothetical protein
MALVPRGQVERDAWREARLDDAETETHTRELLPAIAKAKTRGDAAPKDTDPRQAAGTQDQTWMEEGEAH